MSGPENVGRRTTLLGLGATGVAAIGAERGLAGAPGWSPDGTRLAVEPRRAHPGVLQPRRRLLPGTGVKTETPPPITRLTLVHNWFAELERFAPTGR